MVAKFDWIPFQVSYCHCFWFFFLEKWVIFRPRGWSCRVQHVRHLTGEGVRTARKWRIKSRLVPRVPRTPSPVRCRTCCTWLDRLCFTVIDAERWRSDHIRKPLFLETGEELSQAECWNKPNSLYFAKLLGGIINLLVELEFLLLVSISLSSAF